ncbi:uncharacterized protein LOC117645445 [Thrips palmi]|uniref:Uncharacterized protein LOC117645445 n=1 Tax=Thrips palmi TaxID=161013 RepID=A0A6P8YNL4_THRPL|nr:uncharacterized protein LOC117645445 [Thrips palmi]
MADASVSGDGMPQCLAAPAVPVESLPDEALVAVLRRVPLPDLLLCRAVCRRWRDLALHPDAWRHREFRDMSIDVPRSVLPAVLRLAPCLRRLDLWDVVGEVAVTRCAVAGLKLRYVENGLVAALAVRLLAALGETRPQRLVDLTVGGCEAHSVALLRAVLDLRGLESLKVSESPDMRRTVTSLPPWAPPPASLRRLWWQGKVAAHCALLALLQAHAATLREVVLRLATKEGAKVEAKTAPALLLLRHCERLQSLSVQWNAPEENDGEDSDDEEVWEDDDEDDVDELPRADPLVKEALKGVLPRLADLSLAQDLPSDLHAHVVDCVREQAAPSGASALTRLALRDGQGAQGNHASVMLALLATLPVLVHLVELEVEFACDALLDAVDPDTLPSLRWLFSNSVLHSTRAWAHRAAVTAFMARNPRAHLGAPMRAPCGRQCAECRLPCYCLVHCDDQSWSCVALYSHGPDDCSVGGHGDSRGHDCPIKSVRLAAGLLVGKVGFRHFTWTRWPLCTPRGGPAPVPLQGRVETDVTQCLPDSVLVQVFRHLPLEDLLLSRAVCRRWRDLALHTEVWCTRVVELDSDHLYRRRWLALNLGLRLAPCIQSLVVSMSKVSPSLIQLAAIPCPVRRLRIVCSLFREEDSAKLIMRCALEKIIRRQVSLLRLKHLDIICGEWPVNDSWLQTMYRLPGLERLVVADSFTGSTMPVPTTSIVPAIEGSNSLRCFKWSGPVLYGHVLDVLERHAASLQEVSLTTWYMWEGLPGALRRLASMPALRSVRLDLSSSAPASATTRLQVEPDLGDLAPGQLLLAAAESDRARLEKLDVRIEKSLQGGPTSDPAFLQALCFALPSMPLLKELTVDSVYEEALLGVVCPESTPSLRMLRIEANPLPPHCCHAWLHRPAVRACVSRNARLHLVVKRPAACQCHLCAGLACYCLAHADRHKALGLVGHAAGTDELCTDTKEVFGGTCWIVIA